MQKVIRKVFRFQFDVFEIIKNCFRQLLLLFVGGKMLCLKNEFST